mmetsp:Transcript_31106/g.54063  ORF Transcript_31106/g.54063 Transcript_31106/m.54063 type:complete len:120 (-) Transcript_31106:40-399(-)
MQFIFKPINGYEHFYLVASIIFMVISNFIQSSNLSTEEVDRTVLIVSCILLGLMLLHTTYFFIHMMNQQRTLHQAFRNKIVTVMERPSYLEVDQVYIESQEEKVRRLPEDPIPRVKELR